MENKTTRKQLPAFLVLGIISLVAAVVLAATNMITRGPIAEHQMAALKEAFGAVMPADEYNPIAVDPSYKVSGLYEAKVGGETVGWCVSSSANGYGGPVAVTLGVGVDGLVDGCVIGDLNFAETPGYGSRAKEPAFQEQFVDIDTINGGSFQALSGATLTSNAVRDAVNQALRCVAEKGMGQTPAADPIVVFGAPAEKEAAPELTGDVLEGTAKGFQSDVLVKLTVDASGAVTGINVDASGETVGLGTRCMEEASFYEQFVGKTAPFAIGENIDALTGATVTSKAVVEAVNNVLGGNDDAAKEPSVVLAENVRIASAPGFNGAEVGVVVALDENGAVAGMAVDVSTQAPPVCDMCTTEEFISQFIGKTAPFVKGENVDGVSGATFTADGVIAAVNSLLPAKEEAPAEEAAPAAEELTATAPGFQNADVGVTITLDDTGAIATMTVDVSKQVPPVCDMCTTEEFVGQFIGKTGPFVKGENVDGVSGATFTADGVIAAVNAAMGK